MQTPEPADTGEDIIVYSKSDCPYCARAKHMLQRMNKPHVVITLDDMQARTVLYDKLELVGPARTMPQIMRGSDRIGGYHDLVTLAAGGGLA